MREVPAELISDFQSLTDVEWRRRHEAEFGLFVAEGGKVIKRALELGYRPRAILTQQKWLDEFAGIADLPLHVLSEADISHIAGYHVHRGALASFERPRPRALSELVGRGRVLLVEAVVDHENIGAIFRNAAGLGGEAIILTEGCADPLYRRSLKVSMGSALAVPFATCADSGRALAELRAAGHTLAALTPGGAISLGDWSSPTPKLTLMVGAEGNGLRQETIEAADVRLAIPMRLGTDSLNVATSAAIALWQLRGSGIVPD